MDQVHVIRHKVLVEELTVRQVARQLGISRNTVARYLELPAPTRVESKPRTTPVLDKVGARIEAILSDALRWTGGKQRLTARRLHRLLRSDGFDVGVTLAKEAVGLRLRDLPAGQEAFCTTTWPSGILICAVLRSS